MLATLVVLVLSGFALTKVGTEFLPSTDEGFVSITVNYRMVHLQLRRMKS